MKSNLLPTAFAIISLAVAAPTFTPDLRGQTPPTVNTLYSFTNGTDGKLPLAGLIQANDGNFYGTTAYGGSNNGGTVFQFTPAGVLSTLYSFTGIGTDGANPIAGLIQGNDGNFYGTTEYGGGNSNDGTVFRITPTRAVTILHSFTEFDTDGGNPVAGLVKGSDGNFYGTTSGGGSGDNSGGTVFRITPEGVYSTLHSFTGIGTDGSDPVAGLIVGNDGNFYGTTAQGGGGDGTVFKITPSGVFHTLYSFTDADGIEPRAALVQGRDGNFYGTTEYDMQRSSGTVFKLTPAGVLTTLYSFGISSKNGINPVAALIQASDGNFYGTTESGGYSSGVGTIFQITPTGAVLTLHSFTRTGTDGGIPRAGLIQGRDGNLYGTTEVGGSSDGGTIFELVVAPTVTSATTASAKAGIAFAYQITALNSPTSFGASGLPGGITVSASTGLISGHPTTAGTFAVTLKATNAFGSGTAKLALTVTGSPVITSATTASAKVGTAFSYQITATNNPTNFATSSIPAGLSFSTSTGKLTGTPTKAGTFKPLLSASNSAGKGSVNLTLLVNPAAPVVTSATTASAQVGAAFSYQVAATNSPTSYKISSLPPGLTFNTTTGKLSGTPTKAGSYRPLVSATNAGGTGSANVALMVKPAKPVITSATSSSATVGTAFSYQITATNLPTSYATSSVPLVFHQGSS